MFSLLKRRRPTSTGSSRGWKGLIWDTKPTIDQPGFLRTCLHFSSMLLHRHTRYCNSLSHRGGLFNRHAVGQEQFAWDIRGEPELIKVFAHIWNTEKLLVSIGEHSDRACLCWVPNVEIDAINASLPFSKDVIGDLDLAPWPHVDQSPLRRFKHCVQGIMNLASHCLPRRRIDEIVADYHRRRMGPRTGG